MSSKPTLPLEIKQTIIEILAQGEHDLSTLKVCSLVCQAFLHLCRRHIFASIALYGHIPAVPNYKPTTAALIRLLSTTPEISGHIRRLVCYFSTNEFEQPALPGILKQITRLESLTIRWPRCQKQWNNNVLRSAVLHLLHLPTLIHLVLRDIKDFVIADLIHCINLKKIEFISTKAVDHEDVFSLTVPAKSVCLRRFSAGIDSPTLITRMCTTLRPGGKPVLDFTCLDSLSLVFRQQEEYKASRELFKYCERLTDVYIFVYSPPVTWAGLSKMLHLSMQTLAHLRLDIIIEHENGANDPLAGLVPELEDMRHHNRIQTITITVSIQTDYECNRGDGWGRLDRAVTGSGWPKLDRVSLRITIWSYVREDDSLELALRKLPETQFPGLSSSKSVVFTFSVAAELL